MSQSAERQRAGEVAADLEGLGDRLDPGKLTILAEMLAVTSDAAEAARIRERLTRGFYGI